jgi:hypothetical protein
METHSILAKQEILDALKNVAVDINRAVRYAAVGKDNESRDCMDRAANILFLVRQTIEEIARANALPDEPITENSKPFLYSINTSSTAYYPKDALVTFTAV